MFCPLTVNKKFAMMLAEIDGKDRDQNIIKYVQRIESHYI
jgi:hypothetical protein